MRHRPPEREGIDGLVHGRRTSHPRESVGHRVARPQISLRREVELSATPQLREEPAFLDDPGQRCTDRAGTWLPEGHGFGCPVRSATLVRATGPDALTPEDIHEGDDMVHRSRARPPKENAKNRPAHFATEPRRTDTVSLGAGEQAGPLRRCERVCPGQALALARLCMIREAGIPVSRLQRDRAAPFAAEVDHRSSRGSFVDPDLPATSIWGRIEFAQLPEHERSQCRNTQLPGSIRQGRRDRQELSTGPDTWLFDATGKRRVPVTRFVPPCFDQAHL